MEGFHNQNKGGSPGRRQASGCRHNTRKRVRAERYNVAEGGRRFDMYGNNSRAFLRIQSLPRSFRLKLCLSACPRMDDGMEEDPRVLTR